MKIVEAVMSRSRKVNLGNYESADVFCSMKIEFESSDVGNISSLIDDAFIELRGQVNAQIDITEGNKP